MSILPALFLILVLLLPAAGGDSSSTDVPKEDASASAGIVTETEVTDSGHMLHEVTVPVSGLDREYRLLLVSDLHIIVPEDPEVDDDKKTDVDQRMREMFRSVTPEGMTSAQQWEAMPQELDSCGADMILFAGDMIDYATEATTSVLKEGFDTLKTPWMYVRGDHDYGAWNSKGYESQEDVIKLQEETAPRSKVMRQKTGNLTVIGWDNDTTQMTDKGLEDLKRYLQEAKDEESPVLFLCHVPLKGNVTDALAEESEEKWGKVLLWGDGECSYRPDQTTREAIDMVLSEDSPVQVEASGHIHFPYTGPLTDHSSLVVAAPAFQGDVTLLILTPVS